MLEYGLDLLVDPIALVVRHVSQSRSEVEGRSVAEDEVDHSAQ